ncbi:carbohydrate ABC transporter ATP-binding protein, CUT1 family [Arboricoccus pini]|uniref:Carbohydrate ABC transporter ATP-binding protein, CUT1 family n=1 Tax=Arboricoccus pini TaxID=1963835 RepID=A0A212R889_9PROT|nr:sn-glycerol-3-phosphate ABC transporter ATP-binding protein UgpC [Arboricoccus pini]SNB68349.1 carbohydrate ABC transporter ATP-binding protein, CUT1 family [Arboricoccus pini]
MATLELINVTKRFGSTEVVRDVNLSIRTGEFFVFVGPSGCGKSTILRMMAGLESVSSGEIRIDGTAINDKPAAERGFAMVFQSYSLYPHMTVRQNLAFGLENIGTARPEINRRIEETARLLRIDSYLDRRPKALSGGQRQRAAIGRAVVREPAMFLFDEPLSNLDPELRVAMRIEIGTIHARLGNTMIYVTHDQLEAMSMADRICVLRDGQVEQIGAPLDLYNRPANRFVAGFIGNPRMNFLDAKIEKIESNGVQVVVEGVAPIFVLADAGDLRPGDPVTLGIRPQAVEVQQGTGLDFIVEATEQLGVESYIYGELVKGSKLIIQQRGQTPVTRGQRIKISLHPRFCHLFRTSPGEPALEPVEQRPLVTAAQ